MRHNIEIIYDKSTGMYMLCFVGSKHMWDLISDEELEEMRAEEALDDILNT